MKFTAALFSLALAATRANAAPAESKRAVDDATVLNFALTLEHLENAFYSEALAKFDQNAFVNGGLPTWARKRFVEIGQHEKAHVDFLSGALGDKATKPCKYNFPYKTPKEFAALSMVLEGVGVSAYAGAAQLIQSKDYLTAAAVVLSTEARHASWVASAVDKGAAWSGALDTPLGINEVYTLAASFIVPDSCPASNPKLPVMAFPALTASASPKAGQQMTLTFDRKGSTDQLYATFFTGLSQLFAPIDANGKVTVPKEAAGTVYVVVSKSNEKATDEDIVAGPAILSVTA